LPPYYYASAEVAGKANEETVKDILTSTAEEPKRIISMMWQETTPTENNDAIIRAYIEREKILETRVTLFSQAHDSDIKHSLPELPIEMDLPVGQSLKVGHLSGPTASNVYYTVKYEITG